MNIMRAALEQEGDKHYLRLGGQRLMLNKTVVERHSGLTVYPHAELLTGIRPEHLSLTDKTGPDTFAVITNTTESLGHETILYADSEVATLVTDTRPPGPQGRLVSVLSGHRPLGRGDPIHLLPDLDRLHLFGLDGNSLA
ncbi:hypothetical protein OMP95_09150 [Methylophaga sp. OBS4]|nr:hypothetical protein [Methylophaga sp. OBS4]